MSIFFKPSVKLINQLKYSQKFLLLSVLMLGVVFLISYQLFLANISDIRFLKSETYGVAFNGPVGELLKKIQEFRYLKNSYISGDKTVEPKMQAKIVEIENTMNIIDGNAEKYGESLKINPFWKEIRSKWQTIKTNLETPYVIRDSGIIANIKTLITAVCDNSNLTLDSTIETNYMMDAYCTKIPDFTDGVNLIQDLNMKATANKKLLPEERDTLLQLSSLAKYNFDSIEEDINKVFEEDPDLKPVLQPLLNDLSNQTIELYRMTEHSVLGNRFDIETQNYINLSSRLLDAAYKLYESSGNILADLLDRRISEYERGLLLNLSAAMIGFLIFIYLFVGIYLSISNSIQTLVIGSEKIAKGNLEETVELETRDELSQIASSFNSMRGSLESLIKDIKHSTSTINHAAEEIVLGNNDLAKRTDAQAASLEETSASMEELTVTIKQNTEHAKGVNDLAQAASMIALKGEEVVNQVVDMMNIINSSVRQVSDITSVIDNISFQTNLLSLNSAVEAARAGEQGKGFSVIASEIRNLSQRSTASAKDIRTLINTTVDRIHDGVTLVNQAGATMNEIIKSVTNVSEIISQITAASIEQSNGIEQINVAIGQIDLVTQQNSALVEQAARAAESLEEQTKHMNELVSVFSVSETPRSSIKTLLKGNLPFKKAKHNNPSKSIEKDDEWKHF